MADTTSTAIQLRIHALREEVKRITTTTLRGNFAKPEDRQFWEIRARKLNGELSALEESLRPKKMSAVLRARAFGEVKEPSQCP